MKIMDKEGIRRAVIRITHEILECNKGCEDVCIIGVRTLGVVLAKRICKEIEVIEGKIIPVGILDITLYRDDLTLIGSQPLLRETQINFDITGKKIVLVDDVLYTGRTVRSALNAINDFGRPSRIQLAVLIDRGHRELPIKADYVGKNVPTAKGDEVQVILDEVDKGTDTVLIKKRKA